MVSNFLTHCFFLLKIDSVCGLGFRNYQPIPFINSPMGPMGLLQGTLIFAGTRAMGTLEYMNDAFGISPLLSGVIICMAGVFCGMISIILLTILSTPGSPEKID